VNGKLLRALSAAAAVTAVTAVAAGCSSSSSGGTGGEVNSNGTSSNTMSVMHGMSFGAPEKTTVNVGVVPAMDSAGFFVALHDGLFAQEGLNIKYTPATSSDTVINQQASGQFDITAGNYVSYIQHQIYNHQQLEIVAEASIMQQGAQVILTMPHSGIKTLSQLQGHMLGVNAPSNIDYLLDESTLAENGIGSNKVSFPSQPIPFPEMGSFLASGRIAAATMPEPFASETEQQYGAVTVEDLNQGATQDFPIEGYVVTKQWAQQNPNTLHRFLAALETGQAIADTDRPAVEQAFEDLSGPMNGQVSSSIASVMALDQYPIGLDQTQLQRVSNVMFQFGQESGLKKAYNVSPMIVPTSGFNFAPFESTESGSS
jgi:NitT/TauT family transport system substrate-binding protein